ncbi:TonB family protein [Ghiorsea bivora]|uniref:TonB family protein n=1 Tax=Ghiorsea bivora TaxID=1485545 RepID=UPI00056FBB93|nr:TonB family protein [Ghiorsea bivora]
MYKQGYVSLGLALCVALGVHSLIFLYIHPHTKQNETSKASPIQVIILPQQAQNTAQEATQHKKEKITPVFATPQESRNIHHTSIAKKATNIAPKQQEKRENNPQHKSTNTVQVIPVPHRVQQVILSHIQYPKQARRRGLQGKAEFKLDINKQSIKQVTMLASTGYATLDRAARKGLTNLNALPLNDGSYSLAVVFRIQQ